MAGIAEQLERRRRAAAAQWDLHDEIVLIGAGDPIPFPGRGDRTYPFRSHSEYLYLTDRERPGGVLAFDPKTGWVDFVAPVTPEERLWEGATEDEEGVPLPELAGWLMRREGRKVACLGAPLAAAERDSSLETRAREGLDVVRRPKDPVELERMRVAEQATASGFAALAGLIEPGRTERDLQIELEAAFFRAGADSLAFDTIVAGGPNSAVLHFPPTHRPLEPGDLVLVDAGGECRGYASDVTRTYPAGGSFTPEQAELHAFVREANRTAQARCTPGTEFADIHWAAARAIAGGLRDFGLLKGDVDALVERLRANLPLEAGFVVTIEPGIYFVPALLEDPERRAQHRDAVDWDRAERMLGFGGIRIEDNVHVTDDGPVNLTQDIPVL
jgi:Xaa-Pro aminopeptidase